jgi:hypothetical protein
MSGVEIMNKRIVYGLGVVVMGVGLAAGLRLSGGGRSLEKPPGPAAAEVAPLRFRLSPGTAYSYATTWKSRMQARLFGGPGGVAGGPTDTAEGSVDFDADLLVRVLAVKGDGYLLSYSLSSFRKHELFAMKTDVFAEPAIVDDTFHGKEAFVDLGPDGRIRAIYFSADASEKFRDVMQSFVTATEVVLPGNADARWEATEATATGKIKMLYEAAPDRLHVTRTRESYEAFTGLPAMLRRNGIPTVQGTSAIVLDPAGHLVSFSDSEVMRLGLPDQAEPLAESRASFSMVLREVTTFPRGPLPSLASLEKRRPGERVVGAGTEARLDQGLAKGMTFEVLQEMLRKVARGGSLERGLMAKAAAFLRLNPDACDKLAVLFGDPATSGKSRELIFDLLSSAGSPDAQGAMRTAMVSSAAREDAARYPSLVSRFTFLSKPTVASVDFVADVYRHAEKTGDKAVRTSAVFAMATMTRHLARTDRPKAEAYAGSLVSDLRHASTPEDRATMIAAVGNLARRDDVPLLVGYASDPDDGVRARVAGALREVDDPAARSALVGMTGDNDSTVAALALESLSRRPLDATTLAGLEKRVAEGTTNAQADTALVTSLARQLTPGGPVERMFRSVLARTPEDSELASTLHSLLGQLPAPTVD